MTLFRNVPILYHLKLSKNIWFSDVFSGYKTGTLRRHWLSFLTYFSPVFLFYTTCKRQKSLGFLVIPGGINGNIGKKYVKLFLLIFTKFKNSFFQRATFSNCFQIFKWIERESFLHRIPVFIRRPELAFK